MSSVKVVIEPVVIVGRQQKAGVPSFVDSPSAWDTVVMGKRKMPGIASVRGLGFERRVQKAHTPGLNGASHTDLGGKCREIAIHLRIWTTEHLRELEEILPMLIKPTKKPPATQRSLAKLAPEKDDNALESFGKAIFNQFAEDTQREAKAQNAAAKPTFVYEPIDVEHPALRLFGIKSLHILKVSMPEAHGDGIWEMVFSCTDFIPNASRAAGVGTANASKVSIEKNITSAINVSPPPSSTKSQP